VTKLNDKDEALSKTEKFAYLTSLEINEDNAVKIGTSGRARWQIENGIFNNLKNRGFNFEHNYGHGKINLGCVIACICLLDFNIAQLADILDPFRKEVRSIYETAKSFYAYMKALILTCRIRSFYALLKRLKLNYLIRGSPP
jgi:hypothetical protein